MKSRVVKLEHYDVDHDPIEDLLEPFVESKVWYNSSIAIAEYFKDKLVDYKVNFREISDRNKVYHLVVEFKSGKRNRVKYVVDLIELPDHYMEYYDNNVLVMVKKYPYKLDEDDRIAILYMVIK